MWKYENAQSLFVQNILEDWTANLFGIWEENGKWKMIAGAMLNTRGVVFRKKVDREEEGQVLNLGEFDARFTLLQIWNM